MISDKLEPIVANEGERLELAKVEKLLNSLNSDSREGLPRLVALDGEEIQLPESVLGLLHQVVHQLARGTGVAVVTFHQPLTIEEAAFLLNVRRQYVMQLLKNGEMPFTEVAMDRRIQFDDVMAHKKKLSELHRQGIVELAQMSQELGLY